MQHTDHSGARYTAFDPHMAVYARWCGVAALCLALAGCGGDSSPLVQPTAKKSNVPITRPAVQRIADSEHGQLIASFGGEYRAAATKRLMETIVARVVAASDMPGTSYQVTILNSSTINAFALPSGRLYVTRGLLALANDTAEIASVLAHEIAHVTARHAAERDELKQESALIEQVDNDLLSNQVRGSLTRAKSQISIARFSRQQELEADQIGVRTAAKAGFDAYGAVRFLTALGRTGSRDAGTGQSRKLDFLASHPSTPERIAQAMSAARQIGAPGLGERDSVNWLNAINGIAYGEDPGEGLVRGRRYLNTRFGIGFSVPEAFRLEADGETVVGFTADNAQAIRFDSVTLEAGQTLQSYVGSEWISGVKTGAIEPTTVAGMPAAVTSGRGTNWRFRLAAIQGGARVYRVIVAGQGAADIDPAMRSVLEGFRRLTTAEAQDAGLQRVAVVVADSGDTVTGMASRMAGGQGAERFRILNGLETQANLVPGQRYKLISP
jgi:predicted Zn-dependent protease